MKKFVLATTAAAVVLSGCAGMSDTQRRTGIGAGVGALGGAVIGSATGGNSRSIGTGAAVGAAAGALGGYLWSQRMEAGYAPHGEPFEEAGIAHIEMRRGL